MITLYKFFKFFYNKLGLKNIKFLNNIKYYLIFYVLNYKKTVNEYKLKQINFKLSDKKSIEKYFNKYSNQECVIVGNGPSLNKLDLSKINNIKTFGVNSIFLMTKKNGFKPSFYVVEDRLVVKHNTEQIIDYDVEHKFFPSLYKEKLAGSKGNYFNLDSRFYRDEYNIMNSTNIKFSDDFSKVAYAGQSVTYLNMQLAYYMGFKTVYLIGIDFNYILPKDVVKDGRVWISKGDDPNHFDKSYFGKGKESNDPQLHKTIFAYKKAEEVFSNQNKKIINLTPETKLDVFEKKDFNSIF